MVFVASPDRPRPLTVSPSEADVAAFARAIGDPGHWPLLVFAESDGPLGELWQRYRQSQGIDRNAAEREVRGLFEDAGPVRRPWLGVPGWYRTGCGRRR